MVNYIPVQKFSFFNRYFAFIDTTDGEAGSIFAKHDLRVYADCMYTSVSTRYCVVLVHCRKADTEKFERAMIDLKNKMLLIGNTDYVEFCENWQDLLCA